MQPHAPQRGAIITSELASRLQPQNPQRWMCLTVT